MKVIDLLNKIANGEEVPEKIKYLGLDFSFQHNCMEYLTDYGTCFIRNISSRSLNEEVEIIEDTMEDRYRELEKVRNYKPKPSYLTPKEDLINHLVNDCNCVIEDKKIEHINKVYDLTDFRKDYPIVAEMLKDLSNKQYEIIDKVNGE